MTIVDVHTWGRWEESADELAQHVRPEFQCLIQECLLRGMFVAVATFSMQKELIREVLRSSIRSEIDVPIYGGDDVIAPDMIGKQSQLILARTYFDEKHGDAGATIAVRETVLIDDDGQNIRIAQGGGYRTIHYDPESSEREDALVLGKL